jgi:hypothetical protein
VKVWRTLVYVPDVLAHHEEREVHEGFGFSYFHFSHFCLAVFFVLFVSSVVDTSPQETQNNQNLRFNVQSPSSLCLDVQFHLADLIDRSFEVIAVVKLAHTGGSPGCNQITRPKRQAAREKPDMLTQAADHVARVRGHHLLAVL